MTKSQAIQRILYDLELDRRIANHNRCFECIKQTAIKENYQALEKLA